MNKKNIIYIISAVLFLIGLINLFLSTIINKNTNIELYNPANDINRASEKLENNLSKAAIRNAVVDVKNNANSAFDYGLQKNIAKKYSGFMENIYKNGLPITECYKLNTDMEIDHCMKEYKTNLFAGLNYSSILGYNYLDLVKNICAYGQMKNSDILDCVNNNYLSNNNTNLFACHDLFGKDPQLENQCYTNEFNLLITHANEDNYMDMILSITKGLIYIDEKGRVIRNKIDKQILDKNPQYKSIFGYIVPFFTDTKLLESDIIKKDRPLLYTFIKDKIQYYNNPKNFPIYEYSHFFKDNPELLPTNK